MHPGSSDSGEMGNAKRELRASMPALGRAMAQTPDTGVILLKHAMKLINVRRLNVLLVEDEPVLTGYYKAVLGEYVDLLHVDTLAKCLASLVLEPFHCILLNLTLPDSRGLDTLRAVRRVSQTPVVIVSGSDFSDVEARREGAQAIIRKGDGSARLVFGSVVEALLSAVKEQEPPS